jgi:pyridoxamine 5'-phosphate oxidase
MKDKEPYALFDEWMAEARASELNDSNAMALATADADGKPSVRMVLLKGHGPDADGKGGFIFYTNLESRKGEELAVNGNVALLFHWKSLRRQIRVEGPVTRVSDETADTYFASRARESQLGAWASDQSRPLESRARMSRAHRIGPAILSRRSPSNFGKTANIACMNAGCSNAAAMAGQRECYIRERSAFA